MFKIPTTKVWSSPCLFADLCENKSYNQVIHILFAIYQYIYIYIYIYIVGGKRQVNYKFIPTDLFRGCQPQQKTHAQQGLMGNST